MKPFPSTPAPAMAYGLLVLVMAAWASGIVLGRAVHATMPPVGLSFWRWFIATLMLAPCVVPRLRAQGMAIRSALVKFTVLAVFMVGSGTLLLFAVNYTTATNATLVNATQPAATVLMSMLVLRDHPTGKQISGVISAAVGIVVMVTRADMAVVTHLDFNRGDLFMLTAVFGYALYATLLHRWIKGIEMLVVLFFVCIVGTLGLLPLYIAESLWFKPFPISIESIGAGAFLAAIPTLLGIYLWNICIRSVGPNRSAIFINLLPVFGAMMGITLLGEQLYHYHLIGTGFVCVGILLVVRDR